MWELVIVNLVALALLAALSRREGSTYLRQRERVKEALREANRHGDGWTALPVRAEEREPDFGWSATLRPALVGACALGMVAVVTVLAVEADADISAAEAEADPALDALWGGAAVPTVDLELRGPGEPCADGSTHASVPMVSLDADAGVAAPAVRVATVRLETLEARMDVAVARVVAGLEAAAARRAAVAPGS